MIDSYCSDEIDYKCNHNSLDELTDLDESLAINSSVEELTSSDGAESDSPEQKNERFVNEITELLFKIRVLVKTVRKSNILSDYDFARIKEEKISAENFLLDFHVR